jgi:hypothetical protein
LIMNLHTPLKLGAAALALVALMCHAQALTALPMADAKVAPAADNFYKAPSQATLDAAQPGTVLRYRPIPTTAYTPPLSARPTS